MVLATSLRLPLKYHPWLDLISKTRLPVRWNSDLGTVRPVTGIQPMKLLLVLLCKDCLSVSKCFHLPAQISVHSFWAALHNASSVQHLNRPSPKILKARHFRPRCPYRQPLNLPRAKPFQPPQVIQRHREDKPVRVYR